MGFEHLTTNRAAQQCRLGLGRLCREGGPDHGLPEKVRRDIAALGHGRSGMPPPVQIT